MQLDLFKARKGPAIVFRFPLARRADLVRATANHLGSSTYEAGRRYWTSHAQKIRRDLRAAGLTRREIDEEITSYSRAVTAAVYAAFPGRMTR